MRDTDRELRCMSCGNWLEDRDFSCGLSQLCVACCFESTSCHEPAVEEEDEVYERS